MSLPSINRVLAAALVLCVMPAVLRAQGTAYVCGDGTTSIAGPQYACIGHGGINKNRTLAQSREPGSAGSRTASFPTRANDGPRRESVAARNARLEREAKARREARERREAEARREAKAQRERNAAARPSKRQDVKKAVHDSRDKNSGAYARCKDGSYTKEKNRQKACKSRGGIAKWLRS